MTIEEAIKACKNGAIAAFISGGLTLLLVIFAIMSEAEGDLSLWNDPLNFIDVIILLACAVGMLRRSRAAAVTVFIYFILAKIGIAMETGNYRGILLSLIFLYFYGRAIQGSFTYHKIRKSEDPEYRAAPRWAYFVGIPFVVLFFVLVGFGLLTETDVVPATDVVVGSEVPDGDRSLLIENGILFEDEKIDYFYSYGLASVLEGGSILTERSVIMYYRDEDDRVQIYEMEFADVKSVDLIEAGGFLSDSVYRVSGFEEDVWLNISLSTEGGGDVTFIRALRRKVATSARDPVSEDV